MVAAIKLERWPPSIGIRTDLSIEPLDKIDEPLSLTDLHKAIDARLPQLDLPELILEMLARTGFGAAFTHASERNARAGDIATTICAVLVAEATKPGSSRFYVPRCPRCAGPG